MKKILIISMIFLGGCTIYNWHSSQKKDPMTGEWVNESSNRHKK